MDISIVVAVRNEINHIEKCIRSLFEQDFDGKYEVIVVDGMSDDGTYKLLEKLQKKYNFILLRNPKINAAAGRNIGIKKAKGKLIAFIDGDAYAYKDWLSNIRKTFEKTDAIGVGGPDLLPQDAGHKAKAIGLVMTSPLARGGKFNPSTQHTLMEEEKYVDHIPTCNLCLKREVFDKLGLFDENFVKGQDLELSYRIRKRGYKLFYSPSIRVLHYRKQSIKSFAKQIYKWAKAKVMIIRKYGLQGIASHIYLWPIYGLINLIVVFILFSWLDLINSFFVILLFTFIFYGTVIFFESARLSKKFNDRRLFWYTLLLLPIVHISYFLGVMFAISRRKIW